MKNASRGNPDEAFSNIDETMTDLALAAVHSILGAVRDRVNVRRCAVNRVAGGHGQARNDNRGCDNLLNHEGILLPWFFQTRMRAMRSIPPSHYAEADAPSRFQTATGAGIWGCGS